MFEGRQQLKVKCATFRVRIPEISKARGSLKIACAKSGNKGELSWTKANGRSQESRNNKNKGPPLYSDVDIAFYYYAYEDNLYMCSSILSPSRGLAKAVHIHGYPGAILAYTAPTMSRFSNAVLQSSYLILHRYRQYYMNTIQPADGGNVLPQSIPGQCPHPSGIKMQHLCNLLGLTFKDPFASDYLLSSES